MLWLTRNGFTERQCEVIREIYCTPGLGHQAKNMWRWYQKRLKHLKWTGVKRRVVFLSEVKLFDVLRKVALFLRGEDRWGPISGESAGAVRHEKSEMSEERGSRSWGGPFSRPRSCTICFSQPSKMTRRFSRSLSYLSTGAVEDCGMNEDLCLVVFTD